MTAPDGSPVSLYAALPDLGEADLVHAAVPEDAAILELGCGTGRMTARLVELGHEVVAVDESAEMLRHVEGATTVESTIAALRLHRTFPVVLLASQLLNTPDAADRAALLTTAAQHLTDGGTLVVQWHPPAWFERVQDGSGGELGNGVSMELGDLLWDGDLLSATARYWRGDEMWTHAFVARRLSVADIDAELAAAGLRHERWASGDRTWFTATPQ